MRSEIEGALSLAARHLKKVSWATRRSSNKHISKAQKQLTRAMRYGGPELKLAKDHSRWTVSVNGSRP